MKKSIESNFKFKQDESEVEAERLMENMIALLKAHDCSDDFTKTQIEIIEQLIEKGSHFGTRNSGDPEMTVCLSIEDGEVTAEVKSKVSESDFDKLEDLDRTIQRLRGSQVPYRPYMANPEPVHHHTKNNSMNGSELCRLAFDARVDFDFYVDEEDILNLFAVRSLEQGCSLNSLTEVQ